MDFNLDLFIKFVNCCLLFLWLMSSNMSIFKSPKIMNGQSFGDFSTKAYNVLRV